MQATNQIKAILRTAHFHLGILGVGEGMSVIPFLFLGGVWGAPRTGGGGL